MGASRKASQRALRGYDRWLLYELLELPKKYELQEVLEDHDCRVSGSKDALVDRVAALLLVDHFTPLSVFGGLSNARLREVCRAGGLEHGGPKQALVRRIERAVRRPAIGRVTKDAKAKNWAGELKPGEKLFFQELFSRLARRRSSVSTLTLDVILDRLARGAGRPKAQLRPVRRAGKLFSKNGFVTQPDLLRVSRFPGLDARVVVQLAVSSNDAALATGGAAVAIIKLGLAVARADGVVDGQEEERIRAQARSRLALVGSNERKRVEQLLSGLSSLAFRAPTVAKGIAPTLSAGQKKRLMEHLFDVALADGQFHRSEERLLRKLSAALGSESEHLETLIRFSQLVAGRRTQKLVRSPPATKPRRRAKRSKKPNGKQVAVGTVESRSDSTRTATVVPSTTARRPGSDMIDELLHLLRE